jgi:hypothetical protein
MFAQQGITRKHLVILAADALGGVGSLALHLSERKEAFENIGVQLVKEKKALSAELSNKFKYWRRTEPGEADTLRAITLSHEAMPIPSTSRSELRGRIERRGAIHHTHGWGCAVRARWCAPLERRGRLPSWDHAHEAGETAPRAPATRADGRAVQPSPERI